MWRRLVSSELKTRAAAGPSSFSAATHRSTLLTTGRLSFVSRSPSTPLLSRLFSVGVVDSASGAVKKTVEDVMPIATGHEREEIEAELKGKKVLDINFPVGPFGTKESPAVIKSYYDKRIVGCPGDEGEDEHDVVWFWLSKDQPHECPVCRQYFVLEVVGPGGDPEEGHGHGHDHEHH